MSKEKVIKILKIMKHGNSMVLTISELTKILNKKEGDLIKVTFDVNKPNAKEEEEYITNKANFIMDSASIAQLMILENIFVGMMSQTHHPLTKADNKLELFNQYNEIKAKLYGIKRRHISKLEKEQLKLLDAYADALDDKTLETLDSKYERLKARKDERAIILTKVEAMDVIEKEPNDINRALWTAAWKDFEDDISLAALDGQIEKIMPKLFSTYNAKRNWMKSEGIKPQQRKFTKEQLLKDELDDVELNAYNIVMNVERKSDLVSLKKWLNITTRERELMEINLERMEVENEEWEEFKQWQKSKSKPPKKLKDSDKSQEDMNDWKSVG